MIKNLKKRQIGQSIREEGVQEHKRKAGIPTMGGVIILIPLIVTTVLWATPNPYILIAVSTTLGMAFIGMLDDLTKVAKARSLGLTARQKLAGQVLVAVLLALVISTASGLRFEMPTRSEDGKVVAMTQIERTITQIPFVGPVDLSYLFIPFVVLVVVGATNAVNLTDGLDGLATGVTAVSVIPFLIISYVTGNLIFARHLGIVFIPGTGELAVMCAALFGSCLGFLWYNSHPAEVFMGDTGSLALGGALAAIAVCTRTEVYLALAGGVFLLEALSVIIQVSYFKYTRGKRIFKMSPIHHHFELSGWAEEKVVIRFWIVGLMLSLASIAVLASRLVLL